MRNSIEISMVALATGLASLGAIAISWGEVWASEVPTEGQYAQYEDFELSPGFQPDPRVGSGTSGGTEDSGDCGEIDSTPDHLMTLTRDFDFLQISVEAPGDTTLLIEKPNGERVCSDDTRGVLPEVSGSYPAGRYKIWVGDWGNSYEYQICVSQDSNKQCFN
jgi:hypothetical protein